MLTAQDVIIGISKANGPLDVDFFIDKANKELKKLIEHKDIEDITYQAINVAIAIDCCLDWIYHLKIAHSSFSDDKKFREQFSSTNLAIAMLIDLSNEAKHANRRRKSKNILSFQLSIVNSDYPDKTLYHIQEINKYLIASIKSTDNELYNFITVAQNAIDWIKHFDFQHYTQK